MARPPAPGALPILIALLASCAPWRSDIDLSPGVAAAPVLEVQGWQPPIRPSGPRRVGFGPWSAERQTDRGTWSLVLRRDTVVSGTGACRTDLNSGAMRPKGRTREVPEEDVSCDLVLAGSADTMRLEVKSDAGRPFTGRARSEDWEIELRGTDRLRTRGCLVMPTCGWYLSLDGMDIAAVEADAHAWVFLSPDLGPDLRELAALVAAALLLRSDPTSPFPRGPQRPMMAEPGPAARSTLPGPRASTGD